MQNQIWKIVEISKSLFRLARVLSNLDLLLVFVQLEKSVHVHVSVMMLIHLNFHMMKALEAYVSYFYSL